MDLASKSLKLLIPETLLADKNQPSRGRIILYVGFQQISDILYPRAPFNSIMSTIAKKEKQELHPVRVQESKRTRDESKNDAKESLQKKPDSTPTTNRDNRPVL